MKLEVTKDIVLRDYNKLKSIAFKFYEKRRIKESLISIEVACDLMYNFNLLYCDDDIEKLIHTISRVYCHDDNEIYFSPKENKVAFYDYFALDNRGLTQQYLRALMKLGYEILYITHASNNKQTSNILRELDNYNKSNIYFIEGKNFYRISQEITREIIRYEPKRIFVHTIPNDLGCLLAIDKFEKKIERYLINITDHAFWVGKSFFDYYIEFRNFGYSISSRERKIPESKLCLLPYYPIRNIEDTFEGFPFNEKDKKIIFSGGSIYKIYGSNFFLDTVKYILNKYEDTVFLYVGNGDTEYVNDFIKINNFETRFFLISERKDINKIFEKCYFYLNTFPLIGGLMSQYAVLNKKIPVTFHEKDTDWNTVEELLLNIKNIKLSYCEVNEYYEEIDKLIRDQEYKRKKENMLNDLVISSEEFSVRLSSIIHHNNERLTNTASIVNIDKFSKIYFNKQNSYCGNYQNIFIKRKNASIFIFFKKYLIIALVNKTIRVWKSKIIKFNKV